MLTEAVMRKVGLALGQASSSTNTPTVGVQTLSEEAESTSRSTFYVFDTIPTDTLFKKRFTLIIDLDSVIVEILASHRADVAKWRRATQWTGLQQGRSDGMEHVGEIPPPPKSIQERVASFFSLLLSELIQPKLVTVHLVLGNLSGFPLSASVSPKAECGVNAMGDTECRCRVDGERYWGTTPLWGPHTRSSEDDADTAQQGGTSGAPSSSCADRAGTVSSLPSPSCLEEYCVWYMVYYHAVEVVRLFSTTSSFHVTNEQGIFGAVHLHRETKAAFLSTWMSSSQKSKAVAPIPGGVVPVCVCSSNPSALFVVDPLDGVMVDLYRWLLGGRGGATTAAVTTVRLTHAPATAALLGLQRATLLPTLFAVLQATAEGTGTGHERAEVFSSRTNADAYVRKTVELVNRYGGRVGECLCEDILAAMSQESGGITSPHTTTTDASVASFCLKAMHWQLAIQGVAPAIVVTNALRLGEEGTAAVLPTWLALALQGCISSDAEASREVSQRLVPPMLSHRLTHTMPGPALPKAGAAQLAALHTACCPTQTILRMYSASLTHQLVQPDACCICGMCKAEGPELTTTDGPCPLQLSWPQCAADRPLTLQRLLWVSLPEPATGTRVLRPVLSSAADYDALRRTPSHAQVSVAALLLLYRARLLSMTRTLVWLFHLLRTTAATFLVSEHGGNRGVHTALTDALRRPSTQAPIQQVFAVPWHELLCVQAALGLVGFAVALCETNAGIPCLPPTGIIAGGDLEVLLRVYGFLLPCSNGESERAVLPDAVINDVFEDVYMLLRSETETWMRCKAFLLTCEEGVSASA